MISFLKIEVGENMRFSLQIQGTNLRMESYFLEEADEMKVYMAKLS